MNNIKKQLLLIILISISGYSQINFKTSFDNINNYYNIKHYVDFNYLNKTTGGTITGTTLYDKTIAEQESANVKTVVNREFVEDYVANNAQTPDLSNYVDRTTSQTISGTKTFSNTLKTSGNVEVGVSLSAKFINLAFSEPSLSFNNQTTGKLLSIVTDSSQSQSLASVVLPKKSGQIALISDIDDVIGSKILSPILYSQLTPVGLPGQLAVITDAGIVTYRGVASGGGSNVALVMYDGTNWIYH